MAGHWSRNSGRTRSTTADSGSQLAMACANVAGGYLGARTAIRGGSKLIRWVFLIVVSVLFVKLAIDIWNEYFGG